MTSCGYKFVAILAICMCGSFISNTLSASMLEPDPIENSANTILDSAMHADKTEKGKKEKKEKKDVLKPYKIKDVNDLSPRKTATLGTVETIAKLQRKLDDLTYNVLENLLQFKNELAALSASVSEDERATGPQSGSVEQSTSISMNVTTTTTF